MNVKKSPVLVKKCATEVSLRDGEIYGKKQLRQCFCSLVEISGRYPNLFDLELDHVYVLARVCWNPPVKYSSLASHLDMDTAKVQGMLSDLATFELCEYDGTSEYVPTELGEQFIVDLAVETFLTERTQTLPGLNNAVEWVEAMLGLNPVRKSSYATWSIA
ncbi:hypothetical protein EYC98_18635 [Halieaceae bacterium IMCC14734]|uniref:MarR family transcriptional regulator n=1 Tax=Candidatus Litorirhabdus singularis TaxID=2518993 RepID=A0ABT3TKP2_9GAMM|nr:hypothetical protein [Candidatus Litorirhabdus singularis]MCX2982884.1 hypothetical protein [Candidatus Litorirhabdus singularis]